MRVLPALAAAFALALTTAGCLGGGDGSNSGTTGGTTTAAAQTTPASLKLAVYERAFGECAQYSPLELSRKYHSKSGKRNVATATGKAWARILKAGPDAAPSGRDGCLQAWQRHKPKTQ